MAGMRHVVLLACGLAMASAGMATAGQQRPYRVSDQQLRDLVSRLDTHKRGFHASFARAIGSINGSGERDQATRSVKYFEQATDFLRDPGERPSVRDGGRRKRAAAGRAGR